MPRDRRRARRSSPATTHPIAAAPRRATRQLRGSPAHPQLEALAVDLDDHPRGAPGTRCGLADDRRPSPRTVRGGPAPATPTPRRPAHGRARPGRPARPAQDGRRPRRRDDRHRAPARPIQRRSDSAVATVDDRRHDDPRRRQHGAERAAVGCRDGGCRIAVASLPSLASPCPATAIEGPRWYRSRIRSRGPFLALVPPLVARRCSPCSCSSCRRQGQHGLVGPGPRRAARRPACWPSARRSPAASLYPIGVGHQRRAVARRRRRRRPPVDPQPDGDVGRLLARLRAGWRRDLRSARRRPLGRSARIAARATLARADDATRHTVTSPRSASSLAGPMPRTASRSSTEANGPLAVAMVDDGRGRRRPDARQRRRARRPSPG